MNLFPQTVHAVWIQTIRTWDLLLLVRGLRLIRILTNQCHHHLTDQEETDLVHATDLNLLSESRKKNRHRMTISEAKTYQKEESDLVHETILGQIRLCEDRRE